MKKAIAIIGMACEYPDAISPQELWENVLARRRAFRELPKERLNLSDYLGQQPDQTYAAMAAVIKNYHFDSAAFRIPTQALAVTDWTHWLALDVAARALADAGFPGGKGLPREETGVLLGNSLGGEFARASQLRLRWPFVRRMLATRLENETWSPERKRKFLKDMEVLYKQPFAEPNEESLAGGLANTIAGRICNYFDFKGGGFTVDGACASSLLAVAQTCSALIAGDIQVGLAGGVDLSLDPFELVGFARSKALATRNMRVYDADATGFWPGEGCGLFVLMRYEEALRRDRKIYAVIRGWGVSSDGQGGLTRPEAVGQKLALARAYRRAEIDPATIRLYEGHGTGTPVGDETELRVLAESRHQAPSPAVIGSVKANIGHTKAAAGAAGLIKATMAIHREILPPITGCPNPHPILRGSAVLRVLNQASLWPAEGKPRAAVSAMGFGGVNVHLVLEGQTKRGRTRMNHRESLFMRSHQDCECFVLSAPTRELLRRRLARIKKCAAGLSFAEMADLAARLARKDAKEAVRCAVVAESPKALDKKWGLLAATLEKGRSRLFDVRKGLFLGKVGAPPKIGFLFPGQGGPLRNDGGIYASRFPSMDSHYQKWFLRNPNNTRDAQVAVVTTSREGIAFLKQFGVQAEVAVGHSLGELTALHWAGAISGPWLTQLTAKRGRIMTGTMPGSMISLAARPGDIQPMLEGSDAVIAAYNGPERVAISGDPSTIADLSAMFRRRGIALRQLPVSCAFHSPFMEGVAIFFKSKLDKARFRPLRGKVVSTVTGRELSAGDCLKDLLVRQITEPVQFEAAMRQASTGLDLWIEVGPGDGLTNLAADFVETPAIALDLGGPSLNGLLKALSACYVLGGDVNIRPLFRNRFTKPFSLSKPRFFENPCEQAPPPVPNNADSSPLPPATEPRSAVDISPQIYLKKLLAKHTRLPVAQIADHLHLLKDLHLNSLTVAQIIADAAKHLELALPEAPATLADATVSQVAQALTEGDGKARAEVPDLHGGIAPWVRCFQTVWQPKPFTNSTGTGPIPYLVVAPNHHPLASVLSGTANLTDARALILCLPEEDGDNTPALLTKTARLLMRAPDLTFLLVQAGFSCASFARCLYWERDGAPTRVVNLPFHHPSASRWVLDELADARGFAEVTYDRSGARSQAYLQSMDLPKPKSRSLLGPGDVVVVTGGGKGIAAECAGALAEKWGVSLILLGRSGAKHDEVLASNLNELDEKGVRYVYISVDVTQAHDLSRALARAQNKLGRVTAAVHAAGINQPSPIANLNEAKIRETAAPKVEGLRNLLAALAENPLKLLVSFGSIIARMGMQGQAEYALANEWLAAETLAHGQKNKLCRCMTLDWSVWSEVGMGPRLDSLARLKRLGVAPISVTMGTKLFLNLISRPGPERIIVSGRFGPPETLPFETPEPPFLRFLERVPLYFPKVELVAEAFLSRENDPYLDDHIFQGARLFPAVMALEAAAQAAKALAGDRSEELSFETLAWRRPILIPDHGHTRIRVVALVQGEKIEFAIRTEETRFEVDHVHGVMRFNPEASHPDKLANHPAWRAVPPQAPSGRAFYGPLFFHGERFQCVRSFQMISAPFCLAELKSDADSWFARFLPKESVLGHAGIRDAALHAVMVCVPHAAILPRSVDRLRCLKPLRGPAWVYAREKDRHPDHYVYDLDIVGPEGDILEQWRNVTFQRVGHREPGAVWPAGLLGPYLQRQIQEKTGMDAILWSERADAKGAQSRADLALKTISKPYRRPLRTVVVDEDRLRLSGTDEVMALHAETASSRSTPQWRALLAEHFPLAERIAGERDESLDVACTRIWTAQACLEKAGLGKLSVNPDPVHGPATVRFSLPEGILLTFVWKYSSARKKSAALVIALLLPVPEPAVPLPKHTLAAGTRI